MEEKKFYKNIQQKIDQTTFEPAWNKSDVWQRIEQKQGKRKTPFVWWKSVAASIVLIGGLSIYFLKNNNETVDNQLVISNSSIIKTQTKNPAFSKSFSPISVQTKHILQGFSKKTYLLKHQKICLQQPLLSLKK